MITSKPTKPVHTKVCVPPIRVPKIPAKKAIIIDDSENVIHLPSSFLIQIHNQIVMITWTFWFVNHSD